ncbi:hypothetical protein Acsp04_05000 [Actinomadura sp. NBRC 104425]|uniref:helix-turn-helix domain-containing protein n=1 Tax=Actinomadura sp. NBRC 104425 TaxID=3032204 RepID=UPI0024A1D810|nr:helix-turn-helix domain-containing protein [Actinomadura sp. NBRC 104425]GLZ10265.1 hypothetical protein Acsp04_05000 [Actinomadura sp. NBRC 104425]
MTSRWDVERAVLASDLPPMSRLLLLVLLVHADARTLDTGKYSPSLTGLARATGLGRSTVARELNRLEAEGWVIRARPDVDDARSKRARTTYRITNPTAGLVPERDQASPTAGPDQSQSGTSASPTAGHRSDLFSDQDQISSQVIDKIISVLKETRGRTIDRNHAAAVARQIGPGRTNTLAYVEKVIRDRPDDFLPTPQPPRFTAANGFETD